MTETDMTSVENQVDRVDKALADFEVDGVPQVADFATYLWTIIQSGGRRAEPLLARFMQKFPEEFEGPQDEHLGHTSLFLEVLAILRPELLAGMIEAAMKDEQSTGDVHTFVGSFALRAGAAIGLMGNGRPAILERQFGEFRSLLPEVLHQPAEMGFKVGIDGRRPSESNKYNA